jgi:hypothetical protein
LIAYARLAPGSKNCACIQAEAGQATRTAPDQSLALALAAMASAKRAEPAASAKETAPNEPNVAAAHAPDEPAMAEMSKDEILARQKADAYALDAQMRDEEVDRSGRRRSSARRLRLLRGWVAACTSTR